MAIGSICDAAQQNLKERSLLVFGTKKKIIVLSNFWGKKNDTIHFDFFG
jgi:hypothetical protein